MDNVILFNSIYFDTEDIAVIYAIIKSDKKITKFTFEKDKNGYNIVYTFDEEPADKENSAAITSMNIPNPPRSIWIIDNKNYEKKIHLHIPIDEIKTVDESEIVESGKWLIHKII